MNTTKLLKTIVPVAAAVLLCGCPTMHTHYLAQPEPLVVRGAYGRQGADQTRGGPQFLEGQIGLFSQQRPQLVLMAGDNAGLAARPVMVGTE